MRFITSIGNPIPREFTTAIEYAVNSLLRRACSSDELDGERIQNLLREAQASNVNIDRTTLEFSLRRNIETLATRLAADPSNLARLRDLENALKIVKTMPFPVDLWSAQNHIYALQSGLYHRTRRKAQRGDVKAQEWVRNYLALSELLSIRVPS